MTEHTDAKITEANQGVVLRAARMSDIFSAELRNKISAGAFHCVLQFLTVITQWEGTLMTKLFAWLFAAALVLGLGTTPTLTYAEDPVEEAEEGGPDSGDEDDGDEKEEGE